MLQEEEYDSDTSDEDFVPEAAHVESEDEVGSDLDEDEEGGGDQEENGTTGKVKKKKKPKKERKKKNPLLANMAEDHQTAGQDEADDLQTDLVNSEKEKAKSDDIWADFLADVEDKPSPPPKPKTSSWGALLGNKKKASSQPAPSSTSGASSSSSSSKQSNSSVPNKPSTVKITQVFEFAGEEVRVEKEVAADSEEAKVASLTSPEKESSDEAKPDADINKGVKRSVGLSGIIGLLDSKKKKLTTLEKTKLDWNSFKSAEGIDAELEKHKKSKDGFLDKQAFLERADLRQYEIERSIRMNKRSNR